MFLNVQEGIWAPSKSHVEISQDTLIQFLVPLAMTLLRQRGILFANELKKFSIFTPILFFSLAPKQSSQGKLLNLSVSLEGSGLLSCSAILQRLLAFA